MANVFVEKMCPRRNRSTDGMAPFYLPSIPFAPWPYCDWDKEPLILGHGNSPLGRGRTVLLQRAAGAVGSVERAETDWTSGIADRK